MVIPIADRHVEYAEKVRAALRGRPSIRGGRPLGADAQLRDAQEQKVSSCWWATATRGGAVSPRLRTGEST
jgi:hypothetical protein